MQEIATKLRQAVVHLQLGCTIALGVVGLVVGVAAHAASNQAMPVGAPQKASSFTDISIQRDADGSFAISWTSVAKRVTVYASTNPQGGTSGSAVVGSSSGTDKVTVDGLDSNPRWYFTFVTESGESVVSADHSFHIAKATNMRDIGGYLTHDGRWTRPGLLIRSNKLADLTDEDWKLLDASAVSTIVDLRNPEEKIKAPDAYPDNVNYETADVTGLSTPSVRPDLSKCGLPNTVQNQVEVVKATSDPEDAGTAAGYPLMTCYSGSNNAYKKLIALVESTAPNSALIYHCSAGKDRTGWASAVILTMLGVPRATVNSDFMLSNVYRSPDSVQQEWLDSAFKQVDDAYGSFNNYLHNGLGLTDDDVAALRQALLQ